MRPRSAASVKFPRGIAFTVAVAAVAAVVATGSADADTAVASIPIGDEPRDIAVSPNGNLAYVTNAADDSVSVIDTDSQMVTATIKVGSSPRDVEIAPDGARLYVSNRNDDSLSVIDTTSKTIVTTLSVGSEPQGLGVTPDGSLLFVTNSGSDAVSVVDTDSNTTLATISVGNSPRDVGVTPDGTRAFVTNQDDDTVTVIDVAARAVVDANGSAAGTAISVGDNPTNLAVAPDGGQVFVANQSDSLSVIKADDFEVASVSVPGNPTRVAFHPNGNRAYVTANSIAVLDVATLTVVETVPVGETPFGIAIAPDGAAAYTADAASDSVSVMNLDFSPTVSGTPSAGQVGQVYAFAFAAIGAPTPTMSTTSELPEGLTLSPAGVLAGTPSESGEFTLAIVASNGVNPNGAHAATLVINEAPTLSGTPVNGAKGQPYSFAFTVDGYSAPVVTTTSQLPQGITLSQAGVLSGTPTESGTFPITVTADNGIGSDAVYTTALVIVGEADDCAFGSVCDLAAG